jgi:hypothetical protein
MARLATTTTQSDRLVDDGKQLYVIHPLDDLPEEKCSPDGLTTMRLSTPQKAVLLALRSYIAVMIVLVAIKMMTLAGWIHLFGL